MGYSGGKKKREELDFKFFGDQYMNKHIATSHWPIAFRYILASASALAVIFLVSCGSGPFGTNDGQKKREKSPPAEVTVESLPMTATPLIGDGPCGFQETFAREFGGKHLRFSSIKVGECFTGTNPGRFGEVACSNGEDCSSLAAVISGADGTIISEVEFGIKRLPGRTLGLMLEKVTTGLFPSLGLKVPKAFLDELATKAGEETLVLLGATYQKQSVVNN
jgi:hypothetical protein